MRDDGWDLRNDASREPDRGRANQVVLLLRRPLDKASSRRYVAARPTELTSVLNARLEALSTALSQSAASSDGSQCDSRCSGHHRAEIFCGERALAGLPARDRRPEAAGCKSAVIKGKKCSNAPPMQATGPPRSDAGLGIGMLMGHRDSLARK